LLLAQATEDKGAKSLGASWAIAIGSGGSTVSDGVALGDVDGLSDVEVGGLDDGVSAMKGLDNEEHPANDRLRVVMVIQVNGVDCLKPIMVVGILKV
jgi:hypothetical protein